MSLIGSLEDLALSDILQIVNLSRKSGVLHLRNPRVETRIVFQDGEVICATNNDEKNLDRYLLPLVEEGILSREELNRLLDLLQGAKHPGQTINQYLLKEKGFDEPKTQEILGKVVSQVILDTFTWLEGHFNFDLKTIEDELNQVSRHPLGIILQTGINPQFLSMEGARLTDERKRRREAAPDGHEEMITSVLSRSASEDYQSLRRQSESASSDKKPEESPAAGPVAAATNDAPSTPPTPTEATPPPQLAASPPPTPDLGPVAPPETTETAPIPPPVPISEAVIDVGAPAVVDAPNLRPLFIIDDDRLVLRSIGQFFEKQGIPNHTFSEIASAMRDMENHPRRSEILLVVDLLMPRIDMSGMLGGIEVLEILQERRWPNEIFIMSDHENLTARQRAHELGVNEFLPKPRKKQFVAENEQKVIQKFLADLMHLLQRRLATVSDPAAPKTVAIPAAPPPEKKPEPAPPADGSAYFPRIDFGASEREKAPSPPKFPTLDDRLAEIVGTQAPIVPGKTATPSAPPQATSDDFTTVYGLVREAHLSPPVSPEPAVAAIPPQESPATPEPTEEREITPARLHLETVEGEAADSPPLFRFDEETPEAIPDAIPPSEPTGAQEPTFAVPSAEPTLPAPEFVEPEPILAVSSEESLGVMEEAPEEIPLEPQPAPILEETATPVEVETPPPAPVAESIAFLPLEEEPFAEPLPASEAEPELLPEPPSTGGGPLDDRFAREMEDELGDAYFLRDVSSMSLPPIQASPGLAMLRSMTRELQRAENQEQIPLLILRFASELMGRAVLFFAQPGELISIGAFGIGGGDIKHTFSDFQVPLGTQDNLFQICREVGAALRERFDPDFWRRYMGSYLGGEVPFQSFISPILAEERVVAILYGDNLPERTPIGPTDALEIFLAQAGLALNLATLERRIRSHRESAEAPGTGRS